MRSASDTADHDASVRRGVDHRVDGTAVELEHVDEETAAWPATRSRAEVVDGDRDAERAQRLERLAHARDVVPVAPTRWLDHEPLRRRPGSLEGARDGADEVGRAKLDGRDVDGHREVASDTASAHARSSAPGAERHDQAGRLGDRDEVGGGTGSPSFVRQRAASRRHGLARFDVDDRLVGQVELLALDRAGEGGAQPGGAPRWRASTACTRRRDRPRAPWRRGRRCRRRAHVLGQVAGRRQRDARAGGQRDLGPVEPDRAGGGLGQAARRAPRRSSGGDALEQTANSSLPRRAVRPDSPTASRRRSAYGDQAAVAGRVAERVVDGLEVIEVDQHRDHVDAACERVVQPALEARAVGEAACASPSALRRSSLSSSRCSDRSRSDEHDALPTSGSPTRSATRRSASTESAATSRAAHGDPGRRRHPPAATMSRRASRSPRVDEHVEDGGRGRAADRPSSDIDGVGDERDRAAHSIDHQHQVGGVLHGARKRRSTRRRRAGCAGAAGRVRCAGASPRAAAAARPRSEHESGEQRVRQQTVATVSRHARASIAVGLRGAARRSHRIGRGRSSRPARLHVDVQAAPQRRGAPVPWRRGSPCSRAAQRAGRMRQSATRRCSATTTLAFSR